MADDPLLLNPEVARLRREYADRGLEEAAAGADPWALFGRWMTEAVAAGLHEPNAMVVATADGAGRPSSRMVLLKGYDPRGFVFYTNRGSRKGRELAGTADCALLFPWHPLERQVRVTGVAEPAPTVEVEAYFAGRPRGAQLGAWASRQSEPVADRGALEAAYAEVSERFADQDVPVPPHWGGYRVRPEAFEFWQGRPGRMHDRLEFVRTEDGSGWERRRLAP